MLREFPRRPVCRLISAALSVGMALLGAPPAQAGPHDNRGKPVPLRPQRSLREAVASRPAGQRPAPTPIRIDRTPGSSGPFGWERGEVSVFVKMKGASAAEAYANTVLAARGAKAESDREADAVDASASEAGFSKATAVASQREAQQRALLPALQSMGAKVIYRAQKAVNGIAIQVPGSRLAAIRQLQGVEAVYPLVHKERQTSSSIPFLDIPSAAWDSGTGLGLTGTGIKIGIIDTGIDYLHANFGGNGLLATYTAEKAATGNFTSAGSFPTARVAGGTDLVGDSYSAGVTLPAPDANPMDCNGHGSHVSGIAAGGGVNADGTPYTGPYDGSTNTFSLRIGPGVAPNASLYAIRVFGCGGSTDVVAQALEWAMDPNGDNNMSDHLNVVNMSLGSRYGLGFDADAVASDAAAAIGIIVVASAGNSGDAYFVTGSPAASSRTISVASGTDLTLFVNTSVGNFLAGSAAFGPAITTTPVPSPAGTVVLVNDGVGAGVIGTTAANTADGCSTPFVNAGAVSGNVALIYRGSCGFAVKVKNAQLNGATAVIVANHTTGGNALITMAGSDPTIVISSAFIGNTDGNTLAAASGTATADMAFQSAGDRLSSFSSRGPRRVFGLKPDIVAPGDAITSTQSGHTCTSTPPLGCIVPDNTAPTSDGFIAGSQALTIGGTSMASPHIAGIMALLREEHPNYTNRFLKAVAMNTATNDVFTGGFSSGFRYGPGRVGAGRVHVANALGSDVSAQSTLEGTTVVSPTVRKDIFAPNRVIRTITLTNNGSKSASFFASYDRVVAQPGVLVSLPDGPFVSVPARRAVPYRVQFDYDPFALPNTHDASIAELQFPFGPGFPVGRSWLAEEAGYLVLNPQNNAAPSRAPATGVLRVPLHSAVRGASVLKSTTTKLRFPAVNTDGIDYFTTTGGGIPLFDGSGFDELAISSTFEWQYDSPNQGLPFGAEADLKRVGVAAGSFFGDQVFFGVDNWGSWDSPNTVEFDVYIDNNNDGTDDFVVFNSNTGSGSSPTDSFWTVVCDVPAFSSCFLDDYVNWFSPAVGDFKAEPLYMRPFENSVMVLPVFNGDVGITGRFKYRIETFSREAAGIVESTPSFSFDPTAPGLDFASGFPPFFFDFSGASYSYSFNPASFAADGALGALFLHHHNIEGFRSEGLPLNNWASVSNGSLAEGNSLIHPMIFTVSLASPATTVIGVTVQTYDTGSATAGVDYVAKTQTVQFGLGETAKTFSVKITGDKTVEPNESFGVRIIATTNSTNSGAPDGVGTILNDD